MKSKVIRNKRLDFEGSTPPVDEIKNIIDECHNILVVSHLDPDGDSLGTMLAFRGYLETLGKQVYMMREAGCISDHDKLIADKIGRVLTGGEISQPAWVEEQYILDLEREAFLSLAGTKKTQERMWHTLQTGKPLRN